MERPLSAPKNPFLITHFRILDGEGNPVSEPAPVNVDAQGRADLHVLPEEMRRSFEAYGIKDETGLDRVFPSDGERFINLLKKHSGRHWFCSTNPEPLDE